MARTRNIIKRVRAVRNIRTVTRAMQTVAAARFKAASDRIGAFSPYGNELLAMVGELTRLVGTEGFEHPLLNEGDCRREVLLVITSGRGLCGAYNAAVLKRALDRLRQLRENGYQVELHVVGRRGIRYLEFRGVKIDRAWPDLEEMPPFRRVAALAGELMNDFLAGRIGGAEAAYMQFVSAGRQRPAIAGLLPVGALPSAAADAEREHHVAEYDFYPAPGRILSRLLPQTVRVRLYQCFLDAAASEHFMRRAAMQAASDNADEMLAELRRFINRQRQMQITTELAEIMGGRAGLEQAD